MSEIDPVVPAEPSRDAVLTLTRNWVSQYFQVDPSQVNENTRMMDLDGADSLKMLRLLGAVEKHYIIKMMAQDLEVAQTLRELVDQIIALVRRDARQDASR